MVLGHEDPLPAAPCLPPRAHAVVAAAGPGDLRAISADSRAADAAATGPPLAPLVERITRAVAAPLSPRRPAEIARAFLAVRDAVRTDETGTLWPLRPPTAAEWSVLQTLGQHFFAFYGRNVRRNDHPPLTPPPTPPPRTAHLPVPACAGRRSASAAPPTPTTRTAGASASWGGCWRRASSSAC